MRIRAPEKACRGIKTEGAILHSDWGSQFTSQLFRQTLRRCKFVQNMSDTGRCYDNARMESFFATLKKEKLYLIDTTKLPREYVKSIVFGTTNTTTCGGSHRSPTACHRWCSGETFLLQYLTIPYNMHLLS